MQAQPISLNESRTNVNKHNASKVKNKVQQNTNFGRNANRKGDDRSQMELHKRSGLLNADLNMPGKAVNSTTSSECEFSQIQSVKSFNQT